MTEKLYETDSYITQFEATVISSEPAGDGAFAVTLDRTAFFPHGGGQACDTGILDGHDVFDVVIKNGEIFHYVRADAPFAAGSRVTGEIDFEKRFPRMQNHTGEHILSGVIHRRFGYDNVGFHMGKEDVTLDVNGPLTEEEILSIEEEANRIVWENVRVTAEYPEKKVLAAIDYRSKLDLTDGVRIVTVEGYDRCACCAPHVHRTGEIGMIKILDFLNYKGGMRLHLLCGRDALLNFRKKCDDLSALSAHLSAKPTEILPAVRQLSDKLSAADAKIAALKRRLIECEAASLSRGEKNICRFLSSDFDVSDLRAFVNGAIGCCSGICAAFAGSDEEGYRYVIASDKVDLRASAAKINDALSGRGGGSSGMITGTARAAATAIEAFILGFDDARM